MKEFTVTYCLDDEELKRLARITEVYKGHRLDLPMEKIFEGIMYAGSREEINERFLKQENRLGLTEWQQEVQG